MERQLYLQAVPVRLYTKHGKEKQLCFGSVYVPLLTGDVRVLWCVLITGRHYCTEDKGYKSITSIIITIMRITTQV